MIAIPDITTTIGKTTIIADDCLKALAQQPDGSFDVIVTSPPYNLGIKYNSFDDKQPREQYLEWMGTVAYELKRVLKADGSLFLNLGSKPADPWVALDVANVFRQWFTLQNRIHWIKSIALSDGMAKGHYKPINSKRFINDCHEFVFHFTHEGAVSVDKLAIGVPYQDKGNVGRFNDVDRRDRGNTWFVPYPTKANKQAKKHPATFPPKLAEMCIKLHGVRPDLQVLDPFFGAGSTAIACKALDVFCTGIDVDPDYCEMAAQKLSR